GAGLIGALRLDPRVLLFLSIRPRLKHWRGRVAARGQGPKCHEPGTWILGDGRRLPGIALDTLGMQDVWRVQRRGRVHFAGRRGHATDDHPWHFTASNLCGPFYGGLLRGTDPSLLAGMARTSWQPQLERLECDSSRHGAFGRKCWIHLGSGARGCGFLLALGFRGSSHCLWWQCTALCGIWWP
ncbi:unnamed protein product, partial [Durusdinium trenchii]